MLIRKRQFLACIAALTLAGCATPPAPKTISETLAEFPQLSTMRKLVNDAGLTGTLNETGPYTLFAPTNDAFKAVPAKTLDGLAKDRAALISMMSYHVLQGKIETTEFKEGPTKTVQGASLELYRAGPYVTVGEAMVTMADVEASNGVVQVIDRVLIPPTKK
jgi:uncharacterized surface protein with fasciclin (FAS1) repeats